ncbi:MAG: hypothetical protein OJJ54_06780 [Pseudonocardia sp.]|nr:hypothetical protein [Pseudonocardia sp.]
MSETDSHDVSAARAETRAEPLPEERRVEFPGEDHRAGARAILEESEERVAGAVAGRGPGDDADEHRRSADTV